LNDGTVCDNTSTGVIIEDPDGRYLVFDRNTFPPGTAPAAGHVDDHGGFGQAARAEVAEELGLTVTAMKQVAGGWRDNRCRRRPGPLGPGHKWAVYLATASGILRPSPRETRNARWLARHELQALADRTASYARGRLTDAEFAAAPGIEPVWVQWLADAGIVAASAEDLAAIGQKARVAAARGIADPESAVRPAGRYPAPRVSSTGLPPKGAGRPAGNTDGSPAAAGGTVPSGEFAGYEATLAGWQQIQSLSAQLDAAYEQQMAALRSLNADAQTIGRVAGCRAASEAHMAAAAAAASDWASRQGAVKEVKDATGARGDQAAHES